MKRIFFIRHGESEANAGLPTSDPAATALTKLGQRQAEEAASKFPTEPELIVTSLFLRAKQTAIPLMKRYPHVKCEEWPVHEYTFLSPLRCQNTTRIDRLPLVAEYWERCDPFYCDGDGAESFSDFMTRVAHVRARLLEREEEVVAVYSHQQFINSLQWLEDADGFNGSDRMREYIRNINARPIRNGDIIQVFLKT